VASWSLSSLSWRWFYYKHKVRERLAIGHKATRENYRLSHRDRGFRVCRFTPSNVYLFLLSECVFDNFLSDGRSETFDFDNRHSNMLIQKRNSAGFWIPFSQNGKFLIEMWRKEHVKS